jgi:NADH:ubiquinone oxidoreductase subunit 3 (subunit A)
MPCSISCTLSLVFIVSMIYMNRATTKSQTIQKYEQQLPQELKDIYRKIQQERLGIYYYGYALGFILSLIIIIYNYQKSQSHKTKLSTSHIVCIVVATSFITNYFYYMLSPKTAWMLDHIKTPEQTKAWLQMYKAMQKYYHTGLLLGIIAVALLAIAFRQ